MATLPASVKSTRSRTWFVRSDGSEEYLRQKCKEIASWIDVSGVLAVYHVGDKKENPHCHVLIELTSLIQKQSFDVRIKKVFEVVKRSQYSTKIWDGIRDAGAASYVFHEAEAVVLYNKGWSESELHACRQANAAVQKVVAMNRERASTKLVDKALDHFNGEKPNRTAILTYMLKECRDGSCYYPGTFQLKKYVEEVELRLTEEKDLWIFVSTLESQMWRN